MRKVVVFLIIVCICVISIISIIGYAYARHTTGLKFLTFGAGARACAMGEAAVAVVDNAESVYWNPAGMVFVNKVCGVAAYNQLYPDIADDFYYNFIGSVFPFDNNHKAIGYGIMYVSLGTHPIVKEYEGMGMLEQVGEFSARDMACIFSYAQRIKDNISIGGSIKYIHSRIYYIKRKAYALDIGLFVDNMINNLDIGINLKNYGTKIYYIDKPQADELPLSLRIGVSYKLMDDFVVACDVDRQIYDEFTGVNFGIEGYIIDNVIARIGYFDKGAGVSGVTYGFGIVYGNWCFDFANVAGGELGRLNKVSVRFALW
jgi:hypothetical protein